MGRKIPGPTTPNHTLPYGILPYLTFSLCINIILLTKYYPKLEYSTCQTLHMHRTTSLHTADTSPETFPTLINHTDTLPYTTSFYHINQSYPTLGRVYWYDRLSRDFINH